MYEEQPHDSGLSKDELQTIPEMQYKQAIIQSCLRLVEAESLLRRNYERRQHNFKPLDIINLKVEILACFNLIKHMMVKKGVEKDHIWIYNELIGLSNFRNLKEPSVKRLLLYSQFIGYYLFKLKLTDLLLNSNTDYIAAFNREYG